MTVPASKVKAVCTAAEIALVRASRKPALTKLSLAETKQQAKRAKKLADKWEGLRRDQSRTKRRAGGENESLANTELKSQIFREALASFSTRVEQLEAAASPRTPSKKAAKSRRTAGHRATRAAVRSELSAKESKLNAPKRKKKAKPAAASAKPAVDASTAANKKKPAKKVAAGTSATKTAKTPKKAKKKSAKKMAAPAEVVGLASLTPRKQRKATTAAKQRRVAVSGLTSRVRGHVSARGRRAQAARDQRN
jgi:hypothetical protein